jgi:hypothetical protein
MPGDCCAAGFQPGLCLLRVIRVDIAMSALSSAIHNTGHYHVRPRPVCLPPSCARSANKGHSRRSSCVLASLDLATRDARTVTNDSAYRLQQTCERSAAGVLGLVFCSIAVWRRTSQERWEADCRPSDGKIKGREVRGGRAAEKHRQITARCANCRLLNGLDESAGCRAFSHLVRSVCNRHTLS